MNITIWGSRGSVPTPLMPNQLRRKIREALLLSRDCDLSSDVDLDAFVESLPPHVGGTMGGNTTCFEIQSAAGHRTVVDMGTGLRPLGLTLMKTEFAEGKGQLHILLTHSHWDHIMGFPFFLPAYIPGNTIIIHGIHDHVQAAMKMQGDPRCFPIQLENMGADIRFETHAEGSAFTIADLRVSSKALSHPGTSYAYRISDSSGSVVVATDAEYQNLDNNSLAPYHDFYRDSDVLFFDAQYTTLNEVFVKVEWGHSSPAIGVDIAHDAGVRRLVLVHHDPTCCDSHMPDILHRARRYCELTYPELDLQIDFGCEGMQLTV